MVNWDSKLKQCEYQREHHFEHGPAVMFTNCGLNLSLREYRLLASSLEELCRHASYNSIVLCFILTTTRIFITNSKFQKIDWRKLGKLSGLSHQIISCFPLPASTSTCKPLSVQVVSWEAVLLQKENHHHLGEWEKVNLLAILIRKLDSIITRHLLSNSICPFPSIHRYSPSKPVNVRAPSTTVSPGWPSRVQSDSYYSLMALLCSSADLLHSKRHSPISRLFSWSNKRKKKKPWQE